MRRFSKGALHMMRQLNAAIGTKRTFTLTAWRPLLTQSGLLAYANWRTPKPWRYCPQMLEPVVQT
jgi:hypothetical protein